MMSFRQIIYQANSHKCSLFLKSSVGFQRFLDIGSVQHFSVCRPLLIPKPTIPDGIAPAKVGQIASEDDKRAFMEVFTDVIQDVTKVGTTVGDISKAQKWNSKIIQYNTTGGKLNRGLGVILSLKQIKSPEVLDPEIIRKAHILGWAVEFLQAHFLMADDIMDGSTMRRGKECWYLKPEVGLTAINDSLLLNADIYKLLKIHFSNEPYYIDIVDLFHEATMKTILGQCLDLQSCPIGSRPNFDLFTMDHYNLIVKNKTAFYSFYLPVAVSMIMAGIRENDNTRVANITDKEIHRQARTILVEMGVFYQTQDDFLDVYGDPSLTGKLGTDIANGKCSWLAVVALQRANVKQRKIMKEYYGLKDEESVNRIIELYKELSLSTTYKAFEDSTKALIRTHIQQISRGLNHSVFFSMMDKIYRRTT